MNCEQFENLLADALGEELAAADRAACDAHRTICENCRSEYASAAAALSAMRSLPEPPIMPEFEVAPFDGTESSRPAVVQERRVAWPRERGQGTRWNWTTIARYAAVVVIAFMAGYLYRAGSWARVAPGEQLAPRERAPEFRATEPELPPNFAPRAEPGSFEAALAGAHLQDPSRSDLAKCLIAMYERSR